MIQPDLRDLMILQTGLKNVTRLYGWTGVLQTLWNNLVQIKSRVILM